MEEQRGRPILVGLIVVALAWGVFAFGAPYPWAYWPLVGVSAVVGIAGLVGRPKGLPYRSWPVAAGLALVVVAVLLQLVPLPMDVLVRVSPAVDPYLQKTDLAYAAAALGGAEAPPLRRGDARGGGGISVWHPLSIRPDRTWLGLAFLASFGVLTLGAARLFGRVGVRSLAPALVALGVLVALTGVIQAGLALGEPITRVLGFWTPEHQGSVFGPFVNRNHFAGWMLMALPLAIGYFCALVSRGMHGVKPEWHERIVWFSSREASQVILVGFAIVVMGLSLVLTMSRSGIACFAIAIAIVGTFLIRPQRHRDTEDLFSTGPQRHGGTEGGSHERRVTSNERATARLKPGPTGGRESASAVSALTAARSRGRRRVLLGYLVFLVAVSAGWAGVDTIAARFSTASSDFASRYDIWQDTVQILRDFPLTGTGLNTYGPAMLVYQTYDRRALAVEAHNDYLQLAAEGGLLVCIPIVIAVALFVREVRRRFREGDASRTTYWLRLGAVTGLVAIALQETVEFSLQMPGNAALFCVLAAIAAHRSEHSR